MSQGPKITGVVILLASIAALTGTSAVLVQMFLYGPAPTYRQLSDPPEEHPSTSANETSDSHHGTKDAPFFVDVHHTPISKTEAAQDAAKEFRDAATQWGVLILTGLLAVATVLQFCALLYQGYWLQRSVRLAETALTSAEQAFLFQHGVAITPIKGIDGMMRGWQFIFSWKNSGSTPARRVLLHTSLHTLLRTNPLTDPGDLPSDFDFPDTYGFREPTEQVRLSIGPQGEMASNPKTIDMFDLDEAYSRRRRIFMYGWADYTDIFPKTPRHRTEFCFEIVTIVKPDEELAGRSPFLYFAYGRHNGAEDECYRKADETARQVPYDTPVWPPPDSTQRNDAHSAPP
jgi:hypothetical protein